VRLVRQRQAAGSRNGQILSREAKIALPNGIGQIGRPSDKAGTNKFATERFRNPDDAVALINDMQRFAVEQTRLGIPLLFHEETAHGLAVKGATMLPTPTGLGSTWDPDLVEQGFALVGRQARLRGITVGLSPVLDLLRDPRWGRSEEFFGEDPFHVGEMGAAAVRGLQGPSRPIAPDRVFAMLKHFVHGTPQNGLNVGPSDMSERTLRQVYLPPFQRAVRDAHAAIVMPSYNEVAGVPAHGNADLLQRTGQGLLGFSGAYFSDYNGVSELATVHKMAANTGEAALLARRLAERSLVLLKNDGILPLDPKRATRIALIGPNSREALRGGYSGEPTHAVGVLEGLRAGAGKSVVIEQTDGVWINMPGVGAPETVPIRPVPAADNQRRIAEAVALARRSDIVILCVGDTEATTREAVVPMLPGDRRTLNLFGDQDALVKAVLDCGKPVMARLPLSRLPICSLLVGPHQVGHACHGRKLRHVAGRQEPGRLQSLFRWLVETGPHRHGAARR
jgi:beta-glucosidase-like glycosyl hydrolase